MWAQIWDFFLSWFAHPNITGIALAIAFGIVWLAPFWPPLIRKPRLWAVLVAGALLSLVAVSLVQIPLQALAGRALLNLWSHEVLLRWLLLAGIPQVLLSGLVQEGSKLVPVVVWWWRSGKNITPRMGLLIGAVAGAGLGIFEAQWVHGIILDAGWTWAMVAEGGLMTLAGFWERFVVIAFQISVSALAGYGLARGWGWQFYLLAAFLHSVANYSAVLMQSGLFTVVQVEGFITLWAALVTGGALWLRWRKTEAMPETESETATIPAGENEAGLSAE